MERITRKPFQGVGNIVRFNWHYYVIASVFMVVLWWLKKSFSSNLNVLPELFIYLTILSVIISLSVSYYIYDRSNLYSFDWLKNLGIKEGQQIVNINAGFDETSSILSEKYPLSKIKALDFYDPIKHTEISIERARKAYPAFVGTQTFNTNNIPLKKNSADRIFLILSAHEIRNNEERIYFFKQLKNALHPSGKIVVVEHTRDIYNFMAYNLGFFHFLPKNTWRQNFSEAQLIEESESKITPFISVFTLHKNGTTS